MRAPKVILVALALAFASSISAAVKSSAAAGVWRARTDDLPALVLVISDEGQELSGAVTPRAPLLNAMGFETTKIHLGTRKAAKGIWADLERREARSLHRAAKQMAEVTTQDFKDWSAPPQ